MAGLFMPFYILHNIRWLLVASPAPVMVLTHWLALSLNTLAGLAGWFSGNERAPWPCEAET